jgi:anti-anti-sigma factor
MIRERDAVSQQDSKARHMMHFAAVRGDRASGPVASQGFLIQRIPERHLNAGNAGLLWDRLSGLAGSGETRLLIDLSRVVLIDSCAMRAMLSVHRQLGTTGKLVVFGCRPLVAHAFRLTGMDQVLTIVAAEQQAVQLMVTDAPKIIPLEMIRVAV